jgi:hypothetical protein
VEAVKAKEPIAGRFVGFWLPKASFVVKVRVIEDPEATDAADALRVLMDAT